MASKRRIRWDRISVAAIVLVLLIFLLGSCVSRCTANKSGTAETSNEGSEATAEQTTAPPAETQPPETKDPAAQTMAIQTKDPQRVPIRPADVQDHGKTAAMRQLQLPEKPGKLMKPVLLLPLLMIVQTGFADGDDGGIL